MTTVSDQAGTAHKEQQGKQKLKFVGCRYLHTLAVLQEWLPCWSTLTDRPKSLLNLIIVVLLEVVVLFVMFEGLLAVLIPLQGLHHSRFPSELNLAQWSIRSLSVALRDNPICLLLDHCP